jgi:hypothetical protein
VLVTAACVRCSSRPGGQLDLQPHQVETGDHLGNGMLDLQAGVHLQEEKTPVGAENVFDRAGIAVVRRCCEPDRRGADLVAQRGRQVGRGRFLDDLLEAPLHRTFALEEVDGAALAVAEDLHLDMARPFDEELGIDAPVAEIALRLAACEPCSPFELISRAHDTHALAAAAGCRLDQQRKADLRCAAGELGEVVGRHH